MRALLVGHVTLDRFGLDELPGGGAYYAGHVAHRLGASVRVLTAAGRDFPGEALAGLEGHVLAAARTLRFANAYGAEGTRRQRADAPGTPLAPSALPAGWSETDLIHLSPVLGEVDLAAWRAAVRARFVGVQAQGFVRRRDPDGAVTPARWEFTVSDLAGVGAVVVGQDDLVPGDDLVERLAAAVPVVALTRGDDGCDLFVDGRAIRVGVFRTFQDDPTGAGDAFAAGLFFGLARGDGPLQAAQLGAAAGSIVVEGKAGAALPRAGEAHLRAASVWTL
jgi:bifunctional ADP-heptose synthase (sugar kinase/adenylyltransferase)